MVVEQLTNYSFKMKLTFVTCEFIEDLFMGFYGSSAVKNLSANAGDVVSIPGSGRFPGAGNGNQL